jgi:outer membrane biosynthesis protein TonB
MIEKKKRKREEKEDKKRKPREEKEDKKRKRKLNYPSIEATEAAAAGAAQAARAPFKQTNNRSGFTGVSASGERWIAQIKHGGKKYHLGTFGTAQAAALAYDRAARQLNSHAGRTSS